jgi:hypothetical protein
VVYFFGDLLKPTDLDLPVILLSFENSGYESVSLVTVGLRDGFFDYPVTGIKGTSTHDSAE